MMLVFYVPSHNPLHSVVLTLLLLMLLLLVCSPPPPPLPGITNFLPNVPGSTTVRVCCLPRQQLAAIRNISISPDAFEPWPYNVQQMLNWALEPADEDMLEVNWERGGGGAGRGVAQRKMGGGG
mgnify:CR=1 FL=1